MKDYSLKGILNNLLIKIIGEIRKVLQFQLK
jgi:hypothetical protein